MLLSLLLGNVYDGDNDDEGDVVTDNKMTVAQNGDTVREVLKYYICSM